MNFFRNVLNFLSILLVFAFCVIQNPEVAFADNSDNNINTQLIDNPSGHNVSIYPPVDESGATVLDAYGPGKNGTIDLRKKRMTFAGHATGSLLYSNYYFTGKKSIVINVKNNLSKKLKVKIYASNNRVIPVKTLTVKPNVTYGTSVDGLKSDKKYFLTFSAPSNFEGYVR